MQSTLQFIAPDQTGQRFPTVVWRLQKKGRVEEVMDVYEGKMKQFEYSTAL